MEWTLPSRLTEHGEETELAERDLAEQQEKVPKVFEQVLQAETKELNMHPFEEDRIARIKEILIDCGVGPKGAVDDDEYSDLVDYICELEAKCDRLMGKMYEFKEALWHEAINDESENVVRVEAYPGDKKREKEVFFISCDLIDEMHDFFQKNGRFQNTEHGIT